MKTKGRFRMKTDDTPFAGTGDGKRDSAGRSRSVSVRRARAVLLTLGIASGICLMIQQLFSFEPLWVFGVEEKPLVLIDPGHGGIDGGAENASGTCEKDINLAISRMLKEKLEEYDIRVEMTREEDRGLYTGVKNDGTEDMEIEGRRSIRSLKAEDLNARCDMMNDLEPDVFISVHLNSFKQDRSVCGAQVFFSPGDSQETGERSRQLAELIQQEFREQSGGVNQRTAMRKNDVLILKNARVPAVIAECGFLSNLSEAALLTEESYQQELAESMKKGILAYLGIEEQNGGSAEAGNAGDSGKGDKNEKIVTSR